MKVTGLLKVELLNGEIQKQIRRGFSIFLGASYFKLRQKGVTIQMRNMEILTIPNFLKNVQAMKQQISVDQRVVRQGCSLSPYLFA
jgi:hypothetical protein